MELELNKIHLGDCLELLPKIPDRSVNLILTDLPYGVTQNDWDAPIPLDALWAEWKRILAPGGAVVLTATQPFSSMLVSSNPKWFRHDLVWKKNISTGFLNARRSPMRCHEDILVFSEGRPPYTPQMRRGKAYTKKVSKVQPSSNYGPHLNTATKNTGTRYPVSILEFDVERGLHRTQKPVELMKWLIRTYSNENDIVLDCCIGSGTTAIAALDTGRRFVGIERDPIIHQSAIERLRQRIPTIAEVIKSSDSKGDGGRTVC